MEIHWASEFLVAQVPPQTMTRELTGSPAGGLGTADGVQRRGAWLGQDVRFLWVPFGFPSPRASQIIQALFSQKHHL